MSLKGLDSQHFWDQMDSVPVEKIGHIEDIIVKKLISIYQIKLDRVFFDTTQFFLLSTPAMRASIFLREEKTTRNHMI